MSNVLLMQKVWWSWQIYFYCNKSGNIIQGHIHTFLGDKGFYKNGPHDLHTKAIGVAQQT